MNTETLKTFVLLSNIKNYTQTATQMFVAQSTVTNRIMDLENELGTKLFVRNNKQLSLTQEGEHFLIYAKRILELEYTALDELKHLYNFQDSIRIGATNTIYDCHLASKIVSFQKEHKTIRLDITIGHSMPLIQMLQDKTLDICFTYVPFYKNHIESKVFSSDKLILVTSPENKTYKDGITQKELAHIPYYYCDFPFQDLGSYIRDLFPKAYSFPLVIDRSANILPFLYSGDGYSFLPQSLVEESITANLLTKIPLLDFSIPPISCYLLQNSSSSKNERTNSFTELFIRE